MGGAPPPLPPALTMGDGEGAYALVPGGPPPRLMGGGGGIPIVYPPAPVPAIFPVIATGAPMTAGGAPQMGGGATVFTSLWWP